MSESSSQALPRLDACKLREYGEFADGHRCEELVIAVRTTASGGVETVIRPRQPGEQRGGHDAAPGTEVLVIWTGEKVHNRPKPEVTVHVDGTQVGAKVLAEADALFWTESSMEKFLWPYYGAMRIYHDQVEALKAWYYDDAVGPLIVAVAHVPPSRPEQITTADPGLHVGYVDRERGGELRFEPLSQFLEVAPTLV